MWSVCVCLQLCLCDLLCVWHVSFLVYGHLCLRVCLCGGVYYVLVVCVFV